MDAVSDCVYLLTRLYRHVLTSKGKLMESSVLSRLPKTWRDWLKENVERGCSAESMTASMVESGVFARPIAAIAVSEALAGQFGKGPDTIRPFVHAEQNIVKTVDRDVEIVRSLEDPSIVVLKNVLSPEECAELVSQVAGRMTRSSVISNNNGGTETHLHRTSRGGMFQRGESELVKRIESRIASLINWPVEYGEGLQVLSYGPGDEYRPHYDWFDPSLPGPRKHMEHGGQRVGTLIMYLSDVESGGSTSFPNVSFEVLPELGSAVFFANVTPDGEPDPKTLHAGTPVISGSKLIATKWLRQWPYV